MWFILKVAIVFFVISTQSLQAYPLSRHSQQEKNLSLSFLMSLNETQVNYLLKNGKGEVVDKPVFSYKKNGYEFSLRGKVNSFVIHENSAEMKLNGITIIIFLDDDDYYWHDELETWKRRSLRTSTGEVGVADVFYAGVYSGKHIFHERVFFGEKGHFESISARNQKGHIVCSKRLESDGIFFLKQKNTEEECPFKEE